jgi:predicted transcriptional regulator
MGSIMAEKTNFSFYIDSGLKRRLQAIKAKTNKSIAQIIEMVLEENLERYEDKFDVNRQGKPKI